MTPTSTRLFIFMMMRPAPGEAAAASISPWMRSYRLWRISRGATSSRW
jgi:hypothetical protein